MAHLRLEVRVLVGAPGQQWWHKLGQQRLDAIERECREGDLAERDGRPHDLLSLMQQQAADCLQQLHLVRVKGEG